MYLSEVRNAPAEKFYSDYYPQNLHQLLLLLSSLLPLLLQHFLEVQKWEGVHVVSLSGQKRIHASIPGGGGTFSKREAIDDKSKWPSSSVNKFSLILYPQDDRKSLLFFSFGSANFTLSFSFSNVIKLRLSGLLKSSRGKQWYVWIIRTSKTHLLSADWGNVCQSEETVLSSEYGAKMTNWNGPYYYVVREKYV